MFRLICRSFLYDSTLSDGSRLDDVTLVSARGASLWLFDSGEDLFVPAAEVIDFWPSQAASAA